MHLWVRIGPAHEKRNRDAALMHPSAKFHDLALSDVVLARYVDPMRFGTQALYLIVSEWWG